MHEINDVYDNHFQVHICVPLGKGSTLTMLIQHIVLSDF
jgi:hypothetical protein